MPELDKGTPISSSTRLSSWRGAPCPESLPEPPRAVAPTATAQKTLSFADLLWLFVIGAFLGDIVETLFCRVTAGVWMSRSSLVWGPFSVVWGLALALSTVLLRNCENKSDSRHLLPLASSWAVPMSMCAAPSGELLFGVIFWDYSGFKFNIGGPRQPAVLLFLGHCGGGLAPAVAIRWWQRGWTLVRRHVKPWMTAFYWPFLWR